MPPGTQYSGKTIQVPKRVTYTGTDTLRNGMALCYAVTGADAAARDKVEKPSFANLITRRGFAGVVANLNVAGVVGTGATDVDIIPFEDGVNNVDVYTDQNVAAGDILGPLPGQYEFGRGCVFPCFQAHAAFDGSTNAGRVNGRLQPFSWDEVSDRIFRFFDDFDGSKQIFLQGATLAEIVTFGYQLRGASVAGAYGTGNAAGGAGELVITPNGANIGQLELASLLITMAAGRSAWFRARYKTANIDDDTFIGLQIAGSAKADDGNRYGAQQDQMGFAHDGDQNGVVAFCYSKDNAAARAIVTTSSLVNDTYLDVAMLIQNRRAGVVASSGAKHGKVWTDGTPLVGVANPSVGTDVTAQGLIDMSDYFNDDEAMGLVFAGIGGAAARAVTIDRWELVFNR